MAFDADTGQRNLDQVRTTLISIPIRSAGNMAMARKRRPCSSHGKLYAVGIAGRLQCLRAGDGQIAFGKSITPPRSANTGPLAVKKATVNGTTDVIVPIGTGAGRPVPLFGYTGSPTVCGELLVTSVAGSRGGTIIAFDKSRARSYGKHSTSMSRTRPRWSRACVECETKSLS